MTTEMTRPESPEIDINTDTSYDPAMVPALVEMSRDVLQANGNKSWCSGLTLITDDLDRMRRELPGHAFARLRRDITKNALYGVYVPTGVLRDPRPDRRTKTLQTGVIWVSNKRDTTQVPATMPVGDLMTLCHEVAHALIKDCHGGTWRRAYSILVPLWVVAAFPDSTPARLVHGDMAWRHWLTFEIGRIVTRYAVKKSHQSISDEYVSHYNAAMRTFERWHHRAVALR